MKLILAFIFFVSINSFANTICDYQETGEYLHALESKGITTFKTSKNHKRFSAREKEMIHHMITRNDAGLPQKESLLEFADMYDGEMGSNAGAIKMIADIGDSFIFCQ
jgi:hypothetical protein